MSSHTPLPSPQQQPPGSPAHTKPGVHETRDAPTHDLVLSRLELRRFPDPVSVPVLDVYGHQPPSRPVDVAALRPLLHAGQATLAAAKITPKIGTALFGAGYASDANFTTACDPELQVLGLPSVSRPVWRACLVTATRKDSWQKMAAKLDPFCPSRVPAAAPPDLARFERLADDQRAGLILVYRPGFHDRGTSAAHMTAEVPRS
jgi:hypothetical protein